jgi:hypothetical protein
MSGLQKLDRIRRPGFFAFFFGRFLSKRSRNKNISGGTTQMKIRRMLNCFLAVPVALLAVIAPAQTSDSTPTFKFSNVKAKGASETDTYAVNNAGEIAGDYVDSAGTQHGMILNGSKLTTIDGPSGSTVPALYGLNNSETGVGWYLDSSAVPTGFMYSNGVMTTVAYPGATATEPNGINDNGWIVGSYFDKNNDEYGFYWDTKKYHQIKVKGAYATIAWAINNSNTITVYTLDSSSTAGDGYLWINKKLTLADVPGATYSVLHGIDTAGDLNYTIYDSSNNRHGVLYQASTGTYTQFDDPSGVGSTRADGINDSLEMVGRYTNSKSANVGFKVTTKN